MEQVKVFLYREADGSYSCYMDKSERLNYCLIGEGETAKDAIDDWYSNYEGIKETFKDGKHGEFVEAEFVFSYDLASLLNYYAGRFTFAGLARITGVSAAQLSQYASGYRNASPKTNEKIQNALHNFGKELCQVNLI